MPTDSSWFDAQLHSMNTVDQWRTSQLQSKSLVYNLILFVLSEVAHKTGPTIFNKAVIDAGSNQGQGDDPM